MAAAEKEAAAAKLRWKNCVLDTAMCVCKGVRHAGLKCAALDIFFGIFTFL